MPREDFNPQMLVVAREALGYSQSALARLMGVAPSLISKFESGEVLPTEQNIEKLSLRLDCRPSFFSQSDAIHGLGCSFLFHRQRRTMPVPEQRRVQAVVNLARMRIDRLLREFTLTLNFHPRDIDQDGGPANIARRVRSDWKIGCGPVDSVVGRIEDAGGIVISYPFGHRMSDGMSIWEPGLPPMFFINSELPGDRQRFTLCHELGHVIMHRRASDTIEDEANLFASEFLAPEKEISPSLTNLTLDRAAGLKAYWKVSMKSLIFRAGQLEQISPSKYRRLCMQLSMAGHATNEAFPIPPEKPTLLRNIINYHLTDHGYAVEDLSRQTHMPEASFRSVFMRDPTDAPALRLAQ